jgi:hypothetical protein
MGVHIWANIHHGDTMNPKPRHAKAHSKLVANEYLRLGWTLRRKFYAKGDEEPYEYFFSWDGDGDPVGIDWIDFSKRTRR